MGQNELTCHGQMLRRRTKLFLKNFEVGVLCFPFCLTFHFSVPLNWAVGLRPRAAQLGTWTEPSACGHMTPLSKALLGTTLLLPLTALSHGDQTASICEKLSLSLWLNRKASFSSCACFLSSLSCDLVCGSPWSLEYLFSVTEYYKLTLAVVCWS